MGWSNNAGGWRGDNQGWYVGAVAAPTLAVWNNSDKGPNVSLSGSPLLVATFGTSSAEIVRATKSQSSGKYYFEYSATSIQTFTCCGFANATAGLTSFLGSDTNGLSWVPNGNVFINSIPVGIGSFATGDTLGLAFDIGTQKFWGRVNGGNWNNDILANQNPASGVGGVSTATMASGPYFPTGFDTNADGVVTANFGATAFANAAPSSFGNW